MVRVIYAGALRELAGVAEDVLHLPSGEVGLSELLRRLTALRPGLALAERVSPMIWVFLNGRLVPPTDSVRVRDGDTVMLMPPLYEGG